MTEAHSNIVGGSNAGRRIGCPGSYQQEQRVAHLSSVTSQHAEEGTALHEAMSFILCGDNLNADSVLDKQFNGFQMTAERVRDAIVPALAFFDDYLARVEEEDGGQLEYLVENRVEMPGIPNAFGTADLLGFTPKRSFCWDWKFGAGVRVVADENAQGKFYARGGIHTFPQFFQHETPDWPVDIIIAQPRIEDSNTIWSTTVGELEKFRMELIAAISEAQSDKPTITKGPWCEFAKCKSVCPLWTNAAAETVDVRAEDTSGLTPADLGEFYADSLEIITDLEDWSREIRKQAHQFLEDGVGTIEGWMLAQKRATRSFIDEKKAERALRSRGLMKADMFETKFISPAKAEKALVPFGKTLPEKLVQSVSSGTTLARADSGRKVAATTPEQIKVLAEKLAGG